jgi:hypothetical protein
MKLHLKPAIVYLVAAALFLPFFHADALEQNESCEQLCTDVPVMESNTRKGVAVSDTATYVETRRISLHEIRCNGITVGMNGRIYAAGDGTLIIFSSSGFMQKRISLDGEATCIASDETGTVYLGMVEHVEVYDAQGERMDVWSSLGSNAVITSIAVSQDTVYLADAGNRLVMGFSKTGRLVTIIGRKDTEQGSPGFVVPSPYFDVAVGSDNTLWVANTGRRKLENYTIDGGDGGVISSWGESSSNIEGFCGCCNPSHFALLPDGSFVTSEKGIPRVKVYSPGGQFMGLVAGSDEFEAGAEGLDIAVGERGEILILDSAKGHIRVYKKK